MIRESECARITAGIAEHGVQEYAHVPFLSREEARERIDHAVSRLIPLMFYGRPPESLGKESAWFPDGLYRRADGAMIHTKDGRLHCEDGPALIFPPGDEFRYGYEAWWVGGRELSREEFERQGPGSAAAAP